MATLPIKLQPSSLRPVAYRVLSKKHGLNIQTDALVLLTDAISLRFGSEWKSSKTQLFLEEIARVWKQQSRGLFVDGPGLAQVLKEIAKDGKEKEKIQQSLNQNVDLATTSADEHTPAAEDTDPQPAARSDTLVDALPVPQAAPLNWTEFFNIVNPPQHPNYQFSKARKQFSLHAPARPLENHLDLAVSYFGQRYHLLRDRLSRNENFLSRSFSSMIATTQGPSYDITLIKNVLGRDGSKFVLFGLLSKNINGDFVLEDSSDYIELNIVQTIKTEGSFYCPGMFVIVEGIYSASGGKMANDGNVISGCFYVSNIGHPPAEKRDVSLENYGNLDFLGITGQQNPLATHLPVKIDKVFRKKLVSLEKSLTDHKFIILGSNCFLDDMKIMAGLQKFFTKLELHLVQDEPGIPLMVVMAGSFTSLPLIATNSSVSSISNSENYKNNFDSFTDMLSKFPSVVNTVKFVLIPGPNDPWQSTCSLGGSALSALPQKPISKLFANRLERLLPKGNLVLGWNPARISYLSQEIVLFKEDLMNKFKRNDIVFDIDIETEKQSLETDLTIDNIDTSSTYISTKTKQSRKLVKTLLDQGYLQPFVKDLKVINTAYAHCLRIEPLPSSIVLMDSNFENFEVTYNGCKVVNVSSLINNKNNRKLNYVEYRPHSKRYEFKELYF